MKTPEAPGYRVPDDIAWVDGTEIGLGEELYLTRLPSGDTVQLTGTARMIWHAALEGGRVSVSVSRLARVAPVDVELLVTDFLVELAAEGFLCIGQSGQGPSARNARADGGETNP